jgi:hypothetical protein
MGTPVTVALTHFEVQTQRVNADTQDVVHVPFK